MATCGDSISLRINAAASARPDAHKSKSWASVDRLGSRIGSLVHPIRLSLCVKRAERVRNAVCFLWIGGSDRVIRERAARSVPRDMDVALHGICLQ